ncbi:hypothetical protein HAP48_0001905 [Bradyrhizobium septentrionale]|nr:hypothetical protein [Bradyrhizobium septentrionale]UGY16343.1 hypothetical protein HAP48_0001905 [Bradyrhizobium septentrionale]
MRLVEPHHRLVDLEAFLRRHEAGELRHRRRSLAVNHIAHEICDVGFEDVGDLLQPSGADAVDALLVFLDLLKTDAQLIGQLGLADMQFQSALPQPVADDLVDPGDRARVGFACWHLLSP